MVLKSTQKSSGTFKSTQNSAQKNLFLTKVPKKALFKALLAGRNLCGIGIADSLLYAEQIYRCRYTCSLWWVSFQPVTTSVYVLARCPWKVEHTLAWIWRHALEECTFLIERNCIGTIPFLQIGPGQKFPIWRGSVLCSPHLVHPRVFFDHCSVLQVMLAIWYCTGHFNAETIGWWTIWRGQVLARH